MKIPLRLAIAGLAIGFVAPVGAQEKDTVDSEIRQQIDAAIPKYDGAFNRNDAAATAALYTQDAAAVWRDASEGGFRFR